MTWPDGTVRADLRETAEGAIACYVTPALVGDIDKMLRHGLVEIAGHPGRRDQRVTLRTDPEFLPRLALYFTHYGFVTVLENE